MIDWVLSESIAFSATVTERPQFIHQTDLRRNGNDLPSVNATPTPRPSDRFAVSAPFFSLSCHLTSPTLTAQPRISEPRSGGGVERWDRKLLEPPAGGLIGTFNVISPGTPQNNLRH